VVSRGLIDGLRGTGRLLGSIDGRIRPRDYRQAPDGPPHRMFHDHAPGVAPFV
jgi:hypothetical protein